MAYRIEFVPSAVRAFNKLERSAQNRIAPKIDALAQQPRPHGVEKLAGTQDRYRIRAGDYRIVYVIDDSARLVTIALIGHRRDVYR